MAFLMAYEATKLPSIVIPEKVVLVPWTTIVVEIRSLRTSIHEVSTIIVLVEVVIESVHATIHKASSSAVVVLVATTRSMLHSIVSLAVVVAVASAWIVLTLLWVGSKATSRVMEIVSMTIVSLSARRAILPRV